MSSASSNKAEHDAWSARKRDALEKSARCWNPGKTASWQDFGVDLVIDRREGYFLYDMDGARLIDVHLNGGTYNLGHWHPELIMREREVCMIDFDDAGFGWWLYDLGAALSFIEDREDIDELVAAWVRGCRTQHPRSQDEVDEIPTFIMLRRLLLVAWLGTHADTQIAKSLSGNFTSVSGMLAERYLARYG